MKVMLKDVNAVGLFVKASESYPKDVTVTQGRYIVDGKSMLGVLSLSCNSPVKVETSGVGTPDEAKYAETLRNGGLLIE